MMTSGLFSAKQTFSHEEGIDRVEMLVNWCIALTILMYWLLVEGQCYTSESKSDGLLL